MSGIALRDGLTWQTLPVGEVRVMVDQASQMERLQALIAEWQEATGGELDQVTCNLGLLFHDFERIIKGVD